ncbi:MAG: carboxyl transferase [Lachnospiraceae bacterium]|nr:carboxyl transferase [Lachnospiraceae bacterium]
MSSTAKLSAGDRIATLLDDNSFVEIGSLVTKRNTDFDSKTCGAPGDGVITGYGLINDRPVYVYAQDVSVMGGTIGEMHAKKITSLMDLAMKTGVPVIGILDSAGMRLTESTDALEAFGAIYAKQAMCSGLVPQITAVYGNCGGGCALLTGLSDFVFITKEGRLFVNTPDTIDGNYTGKCDTGSAEFAEKAGYVDFVDEDEVASLNHIRDLVSLLPSNNEDEVSETCTDDLNREISGIDTSDMLSAVKEIADNGQVLEIKAGFDNSMITALIKLNGSTAGIIANASESLTTAGCEKASALVKFCDAFSIPVAVLTNVTGFASSMEEAKTVGRASAALAAAFAEATVPKVSVVAGKAFGSAYLTMNSKSLGADFVYATPDSEIGPMAADLAGQIIAADAIDEASDKAAVREEAAKAYREGLLASENAAKRGYVDGIIEASSVRKYLIYAFEMLYTKREDRPVKKHSTV